MATTRDSKAPKCSNNGQCSVATGLCPACKALAAEWLEAGRKAEVESLQKAARALPRLDWTREDERKFQRKLHDLPSGLRPSRERGV